MDIYSKMIRFRDTRCKYTRKKNIINIFYEMTKLLKGNLVPIH